MSEEVPASVLSIGSVGSVRSIGSVGSCDSLFSIGSAFSWAGYLLERRRFTRRSAAA